MDGEKGPAGENRFDEPRRGASYGNAAAYAGLGFQFAAAILLGLFGGQWLDGKLGTSPLFLIIGVFVGAGGGFWAILRRVADDQRRAEQDRSRRS